jgi:thiamine-phosphate pyrophosphorylase
MRTNVASLVRLMLVTDDELIGGRDLVLLARQAEEGGVTALQVRLKHRSPRTLTELVRTLMAAIHIPVLVNDRPDVALAAGAAGVHLGPDDMPIALTRRIAPPGFIIGASVGSEAESKVCGDADYWGVGPWRLTSTKAEAGAALGPSGFQRLVGMAAGRPCIAIGGVRWDDVSTVAASGGAGVAVVSGILASGDVKAAAGKYFREVERWMPS